MEKPRFEEILRANEEDLQRIRKQYFPLIGRGIITGYNIYSNLFDYSKGKLFLDYLHPNLRPEDRHFIELSERLKSEAGIDLESRITINSKLVDRTGLAARNADYITRPHWKNPADMRFFDFDGRELSTEEISKMRKASLIGESLQYDLLIKIKDKQELRKIIDILKVYASQFQLDRRGRKLVKEGDYVETTDPIAGASDIPLLVCTSRNKKPENLQDFLAICQFNITEYLGDKLVILSTLVRSKAKDIRKILVSRNAIVSADKKYALRVFVEDYIDNP